eukprot:CAMPEP_0172649320 /NCGR_PEP_ID=MMETSP1068-20121228/241728_1 /TAXON_ID=35684 /ORGANISM="Pseudopedinella elastica, Strain CCMP716" /LENGTH=302 /DNA_ID=CAMNT_0013463669 /DNA_START=204 /DNA_END=1113 /DNA_ORIENTATION=-
MRAGVVDFARTTPPVAGGRAGAEPAPGCARASERSAEPVMYREHEHADTAPGITAARNRLRRVVEYALGSHYQDDPARCLEGVPEQNLRRGAPVLLSDPPNRRVVEYALGSHYSIRLDQDALIFAIPHELWLLQVRMELELVDRRHDGRVPEQLSELTLIKVAHSDRPQHPCSVALFHDSPGLAPQFARLFRGLALVSRGVHQVQIDGVHPELGEASRNRPLCVHGAVVGAPEFGGHKNLVPLQAALPPKCLAYQALVLVKGGRVKVPVAQVQCSGQPGTEERPLRTVRAVSKKRNWPAVIQ